MFRRPTSPDRDAVSAAHRRLAAIAAQFAAGGDVGDEGHEGDDQVPGVAEGTSTPPSADPGRHVVRPPRRTPGRLTLSAHHVAVVCVAAVVMIVFAGWWVLRSAPHIQPVQLSSERTLPTATTSATGSPTAGTSSASTPTDGVPASTATAGAVVVDVVGKVRRPGIVRLPAGARVVDALKAAGGARPGVGTRSLNLARPVVDGEQIVVGFHVPALGGEGGAGGFTTAPSTGASIAPVNLNTATAEQLDTLPDIGPVTAQAILTWRTENGSFSSVDELLEVSGIGDATLADIAPYVYV
jgi:competence protein ComEA